MCSSELHARSSVAAGTHGLRWFGKRPLFSQMNEAERVGVGSDARAVEIRGYPNLLR